MWESGTVGSRGAQDGGDPGKGRWCFKDVIEFDIASSKALVPPQDAEFRFRHNGLK